MNTTTLSTPAGPFTIVADADGAVLAAGFTGDVAEVLSLVPPKLRTATTADLRLATDAVMSYLDGDLSAIDAVPVRQHGGGEFLTHAWDVLRDVKPGDPVTYRQFAQLSGRPTAVRAAAQACARNAVALFVPCHRIVRTDGGLGGYRWGLPVKRWLLAHENAG